ncbi:MAG TPA: PAS domain S-box protein [Acidimicrobiales bacterium]|nr:PAS domain S-box protein [Acidimicrobiales bacterium]
MSKASCDSLVLGDFFWNSNDLNSVLGSDGTWQVVNCAWPEQMGWSLEDLQSGPFIDLIHPDDVVATLREFERLIAAPDTTSVEFRNRQRRRDGAYRWIAWSCRGRNGMVLSTGRDITSQVEAQQERADSLEMKRAILDAVVDSIITIDEHLQVLDVSPATERIYGISKVERRGYSSLNIVLTEDRGHVANQLRRLFRGEDGSMTKYRFRARHADGRMLNIETRGRLIRDESGLEPRAVLVSRDVTEVVAAEVVMQDAKEAAERANAAKSVFMSRMSHELRTPLNSVLGFAQILEMELTSPDELEMVGYIHHSGTYLLELINEVLDISRIESGHINVMIEPIVLQDLERECIELVTPQANDLGITIFARSDYDYQVLGDQQRLKQVLLNLLSNAIKYNRPQGSVTISCTQQHNGVRLSVSDTGPGISLGLQARLFTPFDRLDAETSGIEGTGLGLALSKGLVEAIGGTMGVDSEVGKGSTFWIELPNVECPTLEGSKSQPPLALKAADTAESTVLYIEDDLANVQLVERLLMQRPNINLITSLLGGLGIELAQQHRPDLILLDVHLSDMHGFEVLQRLQGDSRTIDIPVVVLSADATTWQRRRFRNAGVEDYLSKPLDLQQLLDVIDQHIGARAVTRVIADARHIIATS